MLDRFRYMMRALERREQEAWNRFTVCGFSSAAIDVFSFFVTIYFIGMVSKNRTLTGVLETSVIVLMFCSEVIIELYRCRLSNRLLYYGSQKLSMKIYELFAKEKLEDHNQKSAMQALTIVRQDTVRYMQMILDFTGLGINVFLMAGYMWILIFTAGWLGLLSSIILVLFIIILFFYYRLQMENYGDKARKCEIKTNAQVALGYGIFEEMKISGDMESIFDKYLDASAEYALVQSEYSYKKGMITVFLNLWTKAIMLMIFAGVFLSGIDLSTFIPITIYVSALSRMASVSYIIVGEMDSLEYAKKSYGVIKECLEKYELLKKEENRFGNMRQKQITFHKGMFVRNLTFAYEGREALFENVSIDIPSGHSIAVIGISGAGKTTFLTLVMGLLKPQSGRIIYDDYDIVIEADADGACKAQLGNIVSYIPQTVYMNGETVRNNVGLFADQDTIDDERVIECLKCAQVWEDVMKMPEGIHTIIGEKGSFISGGQRQRIALARALYKDFELLIMDEATAALDMETEKAVIDSIRQVRKNKTLLIVTHHMSLAQECDIIYKIENKKLIQVKEITK